MVSHATAPGSNERRWRGRSGRIYVARVIGITEAAHESPPDCLGLAIMRDDGLAIQVARPATRITSSWVASARGAGASEVHVIALGAGDMMAALQDLRGGR